MTRSNRDHLRIVLGRIVRRLRQGHEAGELSLSELSVLSRLERHGSLPAGVLAEQERISPQAMTTILAVLEGRGLATRDADARDGRRVSMSATAAGKKLLAGRRSSTRSAGRGPWRRHSRQRNARNCWPRSHCSKGWPTGCEHGRRSAVASVLCGRRHEI